MDRNYLAGRNGDANNAILAAVGYNFRPLDPLAQDTLATLPDHALRSAKPAAKRENPILHRRLNEIND